MIKKQSFISIAILITIANILGKLLGFTRDLLISYHYGISDVTDAFFLALAIPTIILGVFTNAADSVIIPQYNRLYDIDRMTADENYSNIINIITFIGTILSIIIFFFAKEVIFLFAPGFNEEQTYNSVFFLKLLSPIGLCHILYCFYSAYNTRFQFVITRAVLSFATNLIVIIAVLIKPDERMISIVIAYLIAALINAVVSIATSRFIGYRYKFIINFTDKNFKHFILLFLPIMLSGLLFDINLYVDRFLASGLGIGGITALNYASRITSLFDSMIITGIGIVILPYFSKLNLNQEIEKIRNSGTTVIVALIVILLPIAIIGMLFSNEIISIIYERGNFNRDAVQLVSKTFSVYALQICFMPIQIIFSKIFHSFENTKTPLVITSFGVVINIVVSIVLSGVWGITGIAFGTTIATFFNCTIFLISASTVYDFINIKRFFTSLFKIIISSFILILAVLFVKITFVNIDQIMLFLVASIVSLPLYFFTLVFSKCYEVKWMLKKLCFFIKK